VKNGLWIKAPAERNEVGRWFGNTIFIVKPYFNRVSTVLKRFKYGLNTVEVRI